MQTPASWLAGIAHRPPPPPKAGGETEINLRRARIEARWARRNYRRESVEYSTTLNLIHDIRMAAWLFEKMRSEESTIPEHHLQMMRAQLLRKLALAELVAIDLLGNPFLSLRGNS